MKFVYPQTVVLSYCRDVYYVAVRSCSVPVTVVTACSTWWSKYTTPNVFIDLSICHLSFDRSCDMVGICDNQPH